LQPQRLRHPGRRLVKKSSGDFGGSRCAPIAEVTGAAAAAELGRLLPPKYSSIMIGDRRCALIRARAAQQCRPAQAGSSCALYLRFHETHAQVGND
jgi:hypothetical protein